MQFAIDVPIDNIVANHGHIWHYYLIIHFLLPIPKFNLLLVFAITIYIPILSILISIGVMVEILIAILIFIVIDTRYISTYVIIIVSEHARIDKGWYINFKIVYILLFYVNSFVLYVIYLYLYFVIIVYAYLIIVYVLFV